MLKFTCALAILTLTCTLAMAAEQPAAPAPFTNSLGMRMIPIPAGSFQMGSEDGDYDERPVHKVTISKAFFMAATEVSNAQYEQFDPSHEKLRGKHGVSKGAGDAVVFVSWAEAAAFCKWLSEKEGKTYRLPTEAEWEYACDQTLNVILMPDVAPQRLLGGVEQWCLDWYGPYDAADQVDPVGRAYGEMKVTRGGGFGTTPAYSRRTNRLGTLAQDKNWLIGFRVVMGELPKTEPLPAPEPPLWAKDVNQTRYDWPRRPDMDKPFFAEPRTFVHIPPKSNGPLFSQHNHCPSITACPNGDLLAVWFSCNTEPGREMTILASRLRPGREQWDDASLFFKAPDRNMTGSALWWDGKDTIYHFNGLEAAQGWTNLALVMRTSTDNGVTWETRLIEPEHQPRNQVISGTLRTREGYLIQACDAVSGGNGGTAVHISRDGGKTWTDPGLNTPKPEFKTGKAGHTIAGIHAGIVQLGDGSLMAFGRGDSIEGHMPMSLSTDMGTTWSYAPSPWPPISSGQRLVLTRLREGPLLFCSYTDSSSSKTPKGLTFTDSAGREFTGFGLFAAISEDDGKTWTHRRLLTMGEKRQLNGGAWTGRFAMDATHAEPKGYLAITQTPDGMIHLVSSALYYQFNLAWVKAP